MKQPIVRVPRTSHAGPSGGADRRTPPLPYPAGGQRPAAPGRPPRAAIPHQRRPGSQSAGLVDLPPHERGNKLFEHRQIVVALPDEPVHYERFQWLGKEIVDVGGEATLAHVAELEGMPYAALVSLFNDARSKDYGEVSETLTLLINGQAHPEIHRSGS
jgi:hypothetical protein